MGNINKKTINDLDELFGINGNGIEEDGHSQDIEDESYKEPFEDKVDGFAERIAEVANKGIVLEEDKGEETVETEAVIETEEKPETDDGFLNDFDDSFDSIVEEVKTETKETEVDDKDELFIEGAFSGETKKVEKNSIGQKVGNSSHKVYIPWNFVSPSPLYEPFYDAKKEMVEKLTGADLLDFYSLTKELEDSFVDISSETFDPKDASKKMEQVQKYRDRVKSLMIKINKQYFIWERQVDLLRGVLSRIHYEKPVIKNEGIIREHMNDIILYFDNLCGLRESAKCVMANLDGAFECLSRRISVSMDSRSFEK